MSLTIPDLLPDKQPNQVGFITLYIPANIQYRQRIRTEYLSKVPLHTLQGKSKSTSTQDLCRVHPKGATLDRIQLRHIHIRNRKFADRSINDR